MIRLMLSVVRGSLQMKLTDWRKVCERRLLHDGGARKAVLGATSLTIKLLRVCVRVRTSLHCVVHSIARPDVGLGSSPRYAEPQCKGPARLAGHRTCPHCSWDAFYKARDHVHPGIGTPSLALPRELPACRRAIERPPQIVRGPPSDASAREICAAHAAGAPATRSVQAEDWGHRRSADLRIRGDRRRLVV